MANLPEAGVRLVVENSKQAIGNLNLFNKELNAVTRTANKANLGSFTKQLAGAEDVIGNLASKFGLAVPQVGKFSESIKGIGPALSAIPAPALAAVGAIAGVTAAFGAFIALGQRGATLQPTLNAFGNLTAQYGDATEILNRLRVQTKGTVSDFDLLRKATFALNGANKELGQVLADDLGNILNNTRILAEALGIDPVAAQGRFVEAIKKNERELLDELGIIVSADKAYEAYAESIDKSATELTDQEKNTAFATEAIRQLNDQVAKLGPQSEILANLQKPFVLLTNTMDRLALAVQPVFAVFAQAVADITAVASAVLNFVVPVFAALADIVGSIVSVAFMTLKTALIGIFGPFVAFAGEIAPFVIASLQLIADGFRIMASAVNGVLQGVQNLFLQFGVQIGGTTQGLVDGLVTRMVSGGARIIGSFAAGLLRGGTDVVKAVTAIAKIVADFLEGFSPPKKGPLSNIDKGGENVALAWVEGFQKGFVDPVDKVAASVNSRLGAIADFTAGQVAARFKELDAAVQPFTDQLDIAKADLEAIAGFVDPALEAIERQQMRLLREGQIDAVRSLDKEADRLRSIGELRQASVDKAQIALSIVKSQQAQERALLAIQKRRVGEVTAIAKAAGMAAKEEKEPKAKKPKKPTGKAAEPEKVAEEAGLSLGKAPDLFSSEAVERAKAVITGAFGEGLEESGFNEAFAEFTGSTGELQTELSRIGAADPVKKLEAKFEGLGTLLDNPLAGLKKSFNDAFTEIENTIGGLSLQPLLDVFEGFSASEALSSIANAVLIPFQAIKTGISAGVNAIKFVLSGFASTVLGSGGTFASAFNSVFGSDGVIAGAIGEGGFIRTAISGLAELFDSTIGTVISGLKEAGAFLGLAGGGDDTVSDGAGIGSLATQAQQAKAAAELITDAETTINAAIASIKATIETEVPAIVTALEGLKTAGNVFEELTAEGGILSPSGTFGMLFAEGGLFGPGGLLATAFQEGGLIQTALGSFKDFALLTFGEISTAIQDEFTIVQDSITNTLIGIVQGLTDFTVFGVPFALSSLTTQLDTFLLQPFRVAGEQLIRNLNNAIPNESSIGFEITFPDSELIRKIPGLRDLAGRVISFSAAVDLTDDPFGTITARARGGLGASGLTLVGERGPELINLRQPTDIFPADLTRALLAQPQSIFAGDGGGTTNNTTNNSNISNVFNVNRPEDALLIQRRQFAFGGV